MSDENENEGAGAEPEVKVKRSDLVRVARTIAEEYRAQGLMLTVRQLYYQFVARRALGLGSGQNVYKRIVAALSEARVRGEFPMDLIEDRGRDAGGGDALVCEDDVERAIMRAEKTLRGFPSIFLEYARWQGQPKHVSVWVEKEALTGVFEGPCRELGVGLFACRGYPSVSSLHQWCRHVAAAAGARITTNGERVFGPKTPRIANYYDRDGDLRSGRILGCAEEAVILYFGDHDPDGLEIPRSCLRVIREMQTYGTAPLGMPPIRLVRVALTREQIEEHEPPPFPAKETSARYRSYVDETGLDEAWELDALDPATLDRLIRDSIENEFDEVIHRAHQTTIEKRRAELRERMLRDGWINEALGVEDEE